jgi:molybdopterin synthase catalytic subunit
MKVVVLYFAAAREKAGTERRVVEMPAGATVADAWKRLASETPALAPVLASCRAAVDEEFAPPSTVLRDGVTLAVLPPVSGG